MVSRGRGGQGGADRVQEALASAQARFSGVVGVWARNLDSGETVAVRADEPFETASAIKTLILATVFDLVRRGKADLAEPLQVEERHRVLGSGVLRDLSTGIALPLRDVLTLMIVVSDNVATNMAIDRVGGVGRVNEMAGRLGLPSMRLLARLDFESDANDEGVGRSTPEDLGSLYERLHAGRCVGPDEDAAMRSILMQQQYNTLLTRELPYDLLSPPHVRGQEPPLRIASKSGSWQGVRADAGIFYGPAAEYVLVVMSRGCADPRFHVDNEAMVVLPSISRAVWEAWGPPAAPARG